MVALKFGSLGNAADEMHAGDPIACRSCKAILNSGSRLCEQAAAPAVDPEFAVPVGGDAPDPSAMVWDCEFCRARNLVVAVRMRVAMNTVQVE